MIMICGSLTKILADVGLGEGAVWFEGNVPVKIRFVSGRLFWFILDIMQFFLRKKILIFNLIYLFNENFLKN